MKNTIGLGVLVLAAGLLYGCGQTHGGGEHAREASQAINAPADVKDPRKVGLVEIRSAPVFSLPNRVSRI